MSNFTAWRSLVDGEEIGAIPDTVENQSFAWYPFDEYGDTQTESFEDQSPNDNDLDNGSISGMTTLNGVQAGVFDGDGDTLSIGSFSSENHPYTLFVVGRLDATDLTQSYVPVNTKDGDTSALFWSGSFEKWRMFSGDGFNGSNNEDIKLLTGVFDTDESVIRENATEESTGDSGSRELDKINVGHDNDRNNWDGAIGEVIIFDDRLSLDDINEIEEYLANKWSISID